MLSRAAGLEMIEQNGAMSIRRKCPLLDISRSSVYYTLHGAAGVSPLAEWRELRERGLDDDCW